MYSIVLSPRVIFPLTILKLAAFSSICSVGSTEGVNPSRLCLKNYLTFRPLFSIQLVLSFLKYWLVSHIFSFWHLPGAVKGWVQKQPQLPLSMEWTVRGSYHLSERTMHTGLDNAWGIAADKYKHGSWIAWALQHRSKPQHLQKQKAELGTDLQDCLGTFC